MRDHERRALQVRDAIEEESIAQARLDQSSSLIRADTDKTVIGEYVALEELMWILEPERLCKRVTG